MATIKVIKPSFKLFDDHVDPVAKAAEMARICYKTEDPQNPEEDKRLINACIKMGHTSTIEHGYMCVHIPDRPIDPKVFEDPRITQPITSAMIWNQFSCDDISKYTEIIGDDEIYKLVDGANANMHVYPCTVTNFRAWLNIIDTITASAIQSGSPIAVAFICGLLVAANKRFPQIFQQLLDKVNEAFAHAKPDHYLCKIFLPTGTTVLKVAHLSKFYDHFGITCAPACSRYTLSAILRTDRATTHQLVRHRRDVNYSQESQRYCNYGNKGYEVIWPNIDPVKFADTTLPSVPYIPEGKTESVVDELPLEDMGFLPVKSSAYHTWYEAMEIDVNHYELMLTSKMKKTIYQTDENGGYVYTPDGKPVVKEVQEISVPPETARMVLPNSFATTIGVTWTPTTFANLVYWRLDSHAQWSFRSLLGTIIIEGLRTHHAFFENFVPQKVIEWINKIRDQKICTNEDLLNELIEDQKKRQKNLEEAARRMEERIKAEVEARKKAEAKTPTNSAEAEAAAAKPAALATPKMGQPVGPGQEKK